jgi:hypothetical protein
MEKGPIKRNTYPHPTIPAFLMRLDFQKTASVKNYLRTLDFESSEAKIYWSDARGEWLRQAFTSRPDNVVVQWLTAPKGQSVNVRIALQKSGGGMFGSNSGQSDVQQDFNEQRLVYKCRLDPSVDNSGYAGVTRVVRNGGSARMEGSTLVIACETLGTDIDSVPKWKAMLAKLPPYLLEPDGTMKEWAWPTLQERYSHRHISHLYGVWPGDEIDPDRTPQLARAAMMADRRRVPERLAAGKTGGAWTLPSRFSWGAA